GADSGKGCTGCSKGGIKGRKEVIRTFTSGHISQHIADPRLKQSIGLLIESAESGDIEKAWTAYKMLRDLEGVIEQYEILKCLRLELSIDMLRQILRRCMPKFDRRPENIEEAARTAYIYTKIVNFAVLVSKLQKKERNELVVLRLAMGQCLRRLIDFSAVQAPEDAKRLVKIWSQMSTRRPMSQRLSLFDIRLLILGAWKSDRHMLVPYLYQMARKQWQVREENEFQKISAIVLSFYVREHADQIESDVIRGLLEDLNDRHIRLSPSHFSMLILYFGKKRNMAEALRVLDQAMDDSRTQGTEAIYYSTFRAFNHALTPPRRNHSHDYSVDESSSEGGGIERSRDGDELAFIDDLDEDIDSLYRNYSAYMEESGGPQARKPNHEQTPEMKRAARICSSLFQTMVSRNVPVGPKTYRELMLSMLRCGVVDKARSILEFTLDSLQTHEVKAHFIVLYLRCIAHTPHGMRELLWREMRTMPGLAAAMRQFPRRVLIDQFGIFNGDLTAFVERKKNPVVDGRAGEFMHRFIEQIGKATRGAAFINCLLSGNDPSGLFKGFNFPKLERGTRVGSGAAAVEQELVAACRFICQARPRWMLHKDFVYNLLPALPGIQQAEDEPPEMRFIRRLVDDCGSTFEFVAALDEAGVEGYDIGMVNHYLRVKLLGLTFQRYARRKTEAMAGVAADAGAQQTQGLFWPSYMYSQSNGWMSILPGGFSSATSTSSSVGAMTMQQGGGQNRRSLSASSRSAAHSSWEHLVKLLRCQDTALQPDVNTVGIFALACAASGDWELGQRVWDDVFQTAASDDQKAEGVGSRPALLQQGVRVYKHYLNYLAAASMASATSTAMPTAAAAAPSRSMPHTATHEFSDGAIAAMFGAMDRSGVGVTSGLLCQGIRAALEVGNIDVAGALEQWQLHREYRGHAPVGFLQRYMASSALPEIRL
ncbi:hypothetical protein LPJ75_003058, partial [Coemansia sp. RSA 2598]